MAKLIYTAIASLDGYVEDVGGSFEWAAPDEEVLSRVNDLERPIGTYLYGRRMYQTMCYWESVDVTAGLSALERDFAELWRAADKVVYSTTLDTVSSARTRLERGFDPIAVRELKATHERDLCIAGPELAAQALHAGLVEECHLFVTPVIVGGGKPALPSNLRVDLDLLDEHRFGNGVVHLRYGVRT